MLETIWQNDPKVMNWVRIWSGAGAALFGSLSLSLYFLKEHSRLSNTDLEVWRPSVLIFAGASLLVHALLTFGFREFDAPLAESKRRGRLLLFVLTSGITLVTVAWPSAWPQIAAKFERQWPASVSPNAVQTSFKLEMDCQSCARGIKEHLRTHSLAEKAEVHLEKGEVNVWFDPNQTSRDALRKMLTNKGHHSPGAREVR